MAHKQHNSAGALLRWLLPGLLALQHPGPLPPTSGSRCFCACENRNMHIAEAAV